jgi:flagellar protein FliO/FliZ
LGVTEHAVNVLHSSDVPVEVVPQAAPAADTFADIFRDAGLPAAALSRRSEIHRRSGQDNTQPMHGSILAGSTWRQAAEAIRGRRN